MPRSIGPWFWPGERPNPRLRERLRLRIDLLLTRKLSRAPAAANGLTAKITGTGGVNPRPLLVCSLRYLQISRKTTFVGPVPKKPAGIFTGGANGRSVQI